MKLEQAKFIIERLFQKQQPGYPQDYTPFGKTGKDLDELTFDEWKNKSFYTLELIEGAASSLNDTKFNYLMQLFKNVKTPLMKFDETLLDRTRSLFEGDADYEGFLSIYRSFDEIKHGAPNSEHGSQKALTSLLFSGFRRNRSYYFQGRGDAKLLLPALGEEYSLQRDLLFSLGRYHEAGNITGTNVASGFYYLAIVASKDYLDTFKKEGLTTERVKREADNLERAWDILYYSRLKRFEYAQAKHLEVAALEGEFTKFISILSQYQGEIKIATLLEKIMGEIRSIQNLREK